MKIYNDTKLSSLLKKDKSKQFKKTLYQYRINFLKNYEKKKINSESCLSAKTNETSIPKISNFLNKSLHRKIKSNNIEQLERPFSSNYKKKNFSINIERINNNFPLGTSPKKFLSLCRFNSLNQEINSALEYTINNEKNRTEFLKNSKLNKIENLKKKKIIRKRTFLSHRNKEIPKPFLTKNDFFTKELMTENNSKFDIPFRLIPKHNFNPKYQLIYEREINDFEEKNQQSIKKAIDNNLIVKGNASTTVEKITISEKKTKNKILLDKFKRIIIRAAIDLKRLGLSAHEFCNKYENLNKDFFQNELFQNIIHYIRHNNYKKVRELIKQNHYLLYDFDTFKQTALTWAVKRNMFYIISEMVSLGSIINACDLTGKTALHYAVMYGFFECVIILLYELASPFKRDFDGKLPSDYAKDLKTHIALKRAELLHFFHSIGKQWNFEKNVRSGLLFLLKYELHEEFNAEKYCLVNRDIMKF